jgi:hypothetical protein
MYVCAYMHRIDIYTYEGQWVCVFGAGVSEHQSIVAERGPSKVENGTCITCVCVCIHVYYIHRIDMYTYEDLSRTRKGQQWVCVFGAPVSEHCCREGSVESCEVKRGCVCVFV